MSEDSGNDKNKYFSTIFVSYKMENDFFVSENAIY